MFDPALPATNSALSSAVMRSQLTSLKALIDALAAFTNATVDGVTTLDPGQPATASVIIDGTTLRFSFAIPRGDTGAQGSDGSNGTNGSDGQQGPQGQQGPPGEVTLQQLNDALTTAIAGTARNPTSPGPPGFTFSDPPTAAELYALQTWLVDFYNALYRTP